jgi:large subunit ribosomal protein L15
MRLEDLAPAPGAKKNRKRVGRGTGSGHGKTATRGSKGQNSRSGGGVPPWFEGGQMPLQRRVPKRGFTNIFKKQYSLVNLRDLDGYSAGSEIGPQELMEAGLVKKALDGIKLLGEGELSRPLTIRVHKASAAAVAKVQAAGGSVDLLPGEKKES